MLDLVADLRIDARWIVPMTAREELLEQHSLIVRDGRIAAILPRAAALQRYPTTPALERSTHVLMPGFIDAQVCFAPPDAADPDGGTQAALATLIRGGVTCCAGYAAAPADAARAAAALGLRSVIGMPITDAPSAWAADGAESLTKALSLHDEYKGHPLIATAFAARAISTLSDATLARLRLLEDELDLALLTTLHESAASVGASVARHGLRPIERLQALGLLTPALNAAHMVAVEPRDLEQAERAGISLTLCPEAALAEQGCLPPIGALAATGLRLGLGSGGSGAARDAAHADRDLWTDLKLLHYGSRGPDGGPPVLGCWDVLAAATRGGAAALGLDAELGSLESGKWADLCCLDVGAAAPPSGDPLRAMVRGGGRDLVTDVWVCGRALLLDGQWTRHPSSLRTPR
jgi:5-methylthioadenosine/S-adenosylhomocysteine deaminase